MQNAIAMSGVERVCQLHAHLQQLRIGHGVAAIELFEAIALEQLHHDEGRGCRLV